MSTNESNYQLLRTVFRTLLKQIYENADAFEKAVERAAEGKEIEGLQLTPLLERALASRLIRPNEGMGKVYNFFVQRQVGIIADLLLYLDQSWSPEDWPGIDLVNFTTRERLSIDFGFDFAEIEQDFVDELRAANPSGE